MEVLFSDVEPKFVLLGTLIFHIVMPLDRRGRRITVSEKTVRDILNDGREDTENQVLKETEIKAIPINKKKEYKSDGINQ